MPYTGSVGTARRDTSIGYVRSLSTPTGVRSLHQTSRSRNLFNALLWSTEEHDDNPKQRLSRRRARGSSSPRAAYITLMYSVTGGRIEDNVVGNVLTDAALRRVMQVMSTPLRLKGEPKHRSFMQSVSPHRGAGGAGTT